MVNPHAPTNFNRSSEELQEFFLFCFVVAGKTAEVQAQKLEALLQPRDSIFPIAYLMALERQSRLLPELQRVKLGKYGVTRKMLHEFWRMFYLDGRLKLHTVTADDLRDNLPGVGYKTAKFFVLHSRPNVKEAVIDTHVLKFLRSIYGKQIPNSTPGEPERYKVLESLFLAECYKQGVEPWQADIACWRTRGKTINPSQIAEYERSRNPVFHA